MMEQIKRERKFLALDIRKEAGLGIDQPPQAWAPA